MNLSERLGTVTEPAGVSGPDQYQELTARIHRQLVERVDLASLNSMGRDEAHEEIRGIVQELLEHDPMPLNDSEKERLIREVQDETFGLGPLEVLFQDPTIDDILVNSARQVYVEQFGRLVPASIVFKDDAHLLQIIDRIVSRVGRRIDEASPMVDARLPDGSRVNAIIPPLALDGPVLSIRRFKRNPLTMADLLAFGTLTSSVAALLEAAVKGRLNILVSGGTGSGKTTLLNILSGYVPDSERVVTVEDTAELQLQQRHVIRLETRPPNIEGKGQVTQRDLVRNCLRMRPDRILVGEVRGPEALDMLQAMNTGHDGSITTLHSNSPRDALARLETMILMAGANLTQWAMRQQISSAFHLVIQIARFSDGVRRVSSVSELVGMEGEVISMQDLVTFNQTGVAPDGRVEGSFEATGTRPKFSDILESKGIDLAPFLFGR